MKAPKITITQRIIGKYPVISIYTIKIARKDGKKIFGSSHDAKIYVDGAVDMLFALGYSNIVLPQVPRFPR